MRSYNLRTKLSLVFVLGTLLFGYGTFVAFAVPPASPYNAGETLDPTCAPGDVNCTVAPIAIGGTVGSGTDTAILYVDGGLLAEDPADFSYDPGVEFKAAIGDQQIIN